jgi:guanine deaminase
MKHEDYMKLALTEAEKAVDEGNAPFSVVVVDIKGEVVWLDHDRVKEKTDPTAHGEINAIRALCLKMNTLSLQDYTFYTSSEPCPTCLTACIKAKVKQIYFGAETESTASLPIKAIDLAKLSKKYPITVIGGILANECLEQRERLLNKIYDNK